MFVRGRDKEKRNRENRVREEGALPHLFGCIRRRRKRVYGGT